MNICMICTGNTCRSPMAEALLRKHLISNGDKLYHVCSAGINAWPGDLASEYSRQVLFEEYALDISDHKSQRINPEIIEKSDLIITMTYDHKRMLLRFFPDAQSKVFTIGEAADKKEIDINDPYGGNYSDYSRTASQINILTEAIASKIIAGEFGHKNDFLRN
ncbi:MAG: low molecular weight protein arginine phosphatase [Eubacteriales bacterium]|nr:low molecular weight protein arginine phosphatase [Eubacteriales bacterium]MDD3197456.1 low molecular weight protein arginine phosphatase [Eubacteriales bacterium]MDD3503599.1 low molecular weight protein arginine phosphatase [Eubacteriales bacterium]MDD4682559.1 low molecular weight protein arginine phosphatase [Eubacteriales bacterium]